MPGYRIHLVLEGDIQQLTPTQKNKRQGLGEQMQNSNKVIRSCPQKCLNSLNNLCVTICAHLTLNKHIYLFREYFWLLSSQF